MPCSAQRLRLDLRNGSRCASCGKTFVDGRLLDFAHRDSTNKLCGREHNRRIDPSSIESLSKTEKEVKLCDLLCANCHSLETSVAENDYPNKHSDSSVCMERQQRLEFVNAEKIKRKACVDCGVKVDPSIPNFPMFDFGHKPGSQKRAKVSRLVRDRYSLQSIQQEMYLCDLRCKCCHRSASLNRQRFAHQRN